MNIFYFCPRRRITGNWKQTRERIDNGQQKTDCRGVVYRIIVCCAPVLFSQGLQVDLA